MIMEWRLIEASRCYFLYTYITIFSGAMCQDRVHVCYTLSINLHVISIEDEIKSAYDE